MASTRKKTTKDGRDYYEITVKRPDKPRLTKRWYPPEGWAQRSIDKELAKVSADFERAVQAGEVLSRSEIKAQEEQKAQEAAKILTLQDFGEKVFMPLKEHTISENSRYTYQVYLNSTIYPALGKYKLPEVTPAQITSLLVSMKKAGKAQATCVKVYTILQGLFKMAYLQDSIDRNPMDKVERPKARKDEKLSTEPEAYTAQEVQHIMEALDNEPLKWQAMIHVLIDTGIRRGECCALTWENVNLQTGEVEIKGNLCYTAAKGLYLDTPKNGKSRTVYITDTTIKLLQRLRTENGVYSLGGYLFTQEDGKTAIHPQSPTRYFKRFGDRYGINDFHPHKLRHTFASVAITAGADVASVSEILGHSDKAVTLRMYTHADEESKKRASRIFQEALKEAMY